MTLPIPIPEGTRVRINELCPWPERRGLTATVVSWPKVYPGSRVDPRECVILVDDDTLHPDGPNRSNEGIEWSCVIGQRALDPLV